jgi:hypothetical protein
VVLQRVREVVLKRVLAVVHGPSDASMAVVIDVDDCGGVGVSHRAQITYSLELAIWWLGRQRRPGERGSLGSNNKKP